ncbi:MAG: tryptophan--tRNA ligase [Rhodocyclaceae bacterium]|nr:tryptophan--tRNA ligase [Rhodocyclaceae bacterium]
MFAERVLSGMRPTGRLHLGHHHGVLANWIRLQHEYPCLFFVADWHALTTAYDEPGTITQSAMDMVIDWLAAGVDPSQATIFIQSRVPEHAELHLLLSMMTPLGWLERVPTYKDQQEKLTHKDLATYGFLGYPLLQAADILIYRADKVPVGEDQVPHIEFTREIARRFNHLYGRGKTILAEPKTLLTHASRMPGLDGQKMSKSYGNTIALREDEESVRKKIRVMQTDPARVRRTDPGDPDKCPVWQFHLIYSDDAVKQWVQAGCRSAGIGCLECKQPVIEGVLKEQEPMRERARAYEEDPQRVRNIIADGCEKARKLAQETMRDVREAIGLDYK